MAEFSRPVALAGCGDGEVIRTVDEAREFLMSRWPQDRRGPRHRDALDACLKVADGHRSTEDAETAFAAAATEAGLLRPA